MSEIYGACLCGQVRFSCENYFSAFHFCHCSQCQKISGSAHVANLFTLAKNINWLSGKEKLKRFDLPNRQISSAFCNQCGTPMPHITGSGKSLLVPAGVLEGQPNILPQDNIFWHERADWYEHGLQSVKFDGFAE